MIEISGERQAWLMFNFPPAEGQTLQEWRRCVRAYILLILDRWPAYRDERELDRQKGA
jgi:hypothetical protein